MVFSELKEKITEQVIAEIIARSVSIHILQMTFMESNFFKKYTLPTNCQTLPGMYRPALAMKYICIDFFRGILMPRLERISRQTIGKKVKEKIITKNPGTR